MTFQELTDGWSDGRICLWGGPTFGTEVLETCGWGASTNRDEYEPGREYEPGSTNRGVRTGTQLVFMAQSLSDDLRDKRVFPIRLDREFPGPHCRPDRHYNHNRLRK